MFKKEEWVWIDGYKGTDKNMRCRGFQFEMDTVFEIPDDQEVELCKNGFHLCTEFNHVFRFYAVENGNRFFAVKALVRQADLLESRDKIVSKAISFKEELTPDMILSTFAKHYLTVSDQARLNISAWTEEQKRRALNTGIHIAFQHVMADRLEALGYSKPFATHIVELGAYETAVRVGSQADLSMDMKAMFIYQSMMLQQKAQEEHYRRYRSRPEISPSYRFG